MEYIVEFYGILLTYLLFTGSVTRPIEPSDDMEKRIYQPSLLWAKAESWVRAQEPDRQLNPTDLQLVVYRTDKSGGYIMHGPKLYWTEEPLSGQYFSNCEQSALADNADKLGEVVLYDRRFRRTHLLGKTYIEAWEKLSK